MRTRFLPAALALALCATTVRAQSVAGEWDAAMNTPFGVRNFKLLFQVSGQQLTGTVKRAAGDVNLTGTVKDSTVNFGYTIDYNGAPLVLTITATVKGDSLKGTVDFGGQAQDEFWARRASAPRPPTESLRQGATETERPRALVIPSGAHAADRPW